MATLPEEVLKKGRALVIAQDLEGLRQWLIEHDVPIRHDVVLRTMKPIFDVGRTDKAIRMFRVIEETDVDLERRKNKIYTAVALLVLAGISGGIFYSAKTLIGLFANG